MLVHDLVEQRRRQPERGDLVLFEQALFNLLDNSSKYAPERSTIRLVAQRDGARVLLQVIDEGSGIPVGSLEHIFDKFYRSQNSRETDGAGLGLAICNSILHLQDGTIHAVPGLTNGVSMIFTLPISKDVPEMEPTEE